MNLEADLNKNNPIFRDRVVFLKVACTNMRYYALLPR